MIDRPRAGAPPRIVAVLLLVIGIASTVVGFVLYSALYGGNRPDLLGLQLAGSVEAAAKIAAPPMEGFYDALLADDWLIGGYTIGLVLITLVGSRCFAGPRARRVASAALVAALGAGALDAVENWAVTRGLEQLGRPSADEAWWRVAASADILKLALLLPTITVALVTVLVVGVRALRHPSVRPEKVEAGSLTSGAASPWLPPAVEVERPEGQVGVCVSGGGIRSACVTLGALQVLRPAGWLRDDGYLFSVSGGGYMAGALRLAMQPEGTGNPPVAERAPALYAPDSPELRHMRDHGNYVARGARQWLVALGVVLAHLVYSLFLLAAVAVAVGLVLGFLYRRYPLAGPGLDAAIRHQGHDPAGVVWLLGTLAALTVVLWIAAGAREGLAGRPSPGWRRPARAAAVVTLGVAILTMAVPALALWVAQNHVVAQTTGAVSAVLTAVSAVGTMSSSFSTSASGSGLGARLIRYLAPVGVVVVVALLVLAMLIVMAWTVNAVVAPMTSATFWLVPGLGVGVVVAAVASISFDQTAASLHPFYRERMNTVFATRRTDNDQAAPYPYSEETELSEYAEKVDGFPTLVFVATAQVAPGAGEPTQPVPYTFTGDWVGGAQIGFIRTDALHARVPRCYRGDLTVLGAMALSGAAFASAMGVMSKPFEVLLALSNARLGAWLPNPWWLGREHDDPESRGWARRRLPTVRRESYHLREIVDSHPLHDPLVLVTDGGHYDNLGLVEALRHRCTTIVVVDSSGDAPPYATTLLDALRLAHDELGVSVRLDQPDDLAPGSVLLDEPLPEPLKSLLPRMSKSALVTGTITYPARTEGELSGKLVVVKTRLIEDLPYDVLSYAQANPDFPYDSTADQWFDRDQFDAYHGLGRRLGEIAVEALSDSPSTSTNGSGPPSPTARSSAIDWTLIMQGRSWGNGTSATQPQG